MVRERKEHEKSLGNTCILTLEFRVYNRKTQGTNHTCKCVFNQNKRKLWYESHESRIREINAKINSSEELDIVFLGDSITEAFTGRWIIFQRNLEDIADVFST